MNKSVLDMKLVAKGLKVPVTHNYYFVNFKIKMINTMGFIRLNDLSGTNFSLYSVVNWRYKPLENVTVIQVKKKNCL